MPAPVQWQLVEIPLGQGLSEKTARLFRKPGTLRAAHNVEFDREGALNKRRGYTRVTLTQEVTDRTCDQVFVGLCMFGGSLIILGLDNVYEMASIDADINGQTDTIVERGPHLRGHLKIRQVVSAGYGDPQWEDVT
jgi:hypothetical protein